VQRILSLGTLGVLGGLVWMFLSGGGLNQLAESANTPAPGAAGATWNGGAGSTWPTTTMPAATTPPVMQPAVTAPPSQLGPTIRIASFNIQKFGQAKAERPAVIATLAAIVQQFHVVAIQEITTQDNYFIPKFLQLVNQSGRRYDCVVSDRLGNTNQTEQYAFLFDTDMVECSRSSVYIVGDPNNLLHREPYVATFRTAPSKVNPDQAFTFTLINVHTDPSANVLAKELDALAEVYRVVRRAGGNEDDVIMLGDFNADPDHFGRLGAIPGITPLIHGRGVFSNTRQNALYDNIVVHGPSTTEYAGRSEVYNFMTQYNLAQDQAESVSDHFPVWAEFSVYERDKLGNIASRGGLAR
jgi:endonuclease/exonuclease/phosphatase family metal-dependent hydrolase